MANVPRDLDEAPLGSAGASSSASGAWDAPSFDAEPGAAVGERYVLRRRLGAGGMGTVFAAWDTERGAEVALKVLQRLEPKSIRRLKAEFRSLADISHPNLATLHELVSMGRQWFLTMELVDGVDFLAWAWARPRLAATAPVTEETGAPLGSERARPLGAVDGQARRARAHEEQQSTIVGEAPTAPPARPRLEVEGRPSTLDWQRLRAALRQLAGGVAALHGAGKLHRDLKPSNVLVDGAGRVVVLDFGLVTRVPRGDGADDDATVCGTPAYMAPEQAVGGRASTASDWYAFGGILYEALTGRQPFLGDFRALVRQKVASAPPPIAALAPDVPPDLAELAAALLDRDPRARPTGVEVLRVLGAYPTAPLVASSEGWNTEAALVGRQAELRALREALARSRTGRPAIVSVKGRSGMGKSALVRAFCQEVEREDLTAHVLSGRCFERESVPFKAFDGVLDALAARLAASTREERTALAPADPAALVRMFPAFESVFTAAGAGDDAPALSGRALRRRAVAALREVLGALARRGVVVIHLDDVQWSDPDSGDLLAELVHGEAPPALLWILGFRAEEEAGHAWLRELPRWIDAWGATVAFRSLLVEPLPEGEALALARARLGAQATPGRAEALVREAAGCPLLVDQIARFEAEQGRVSPMRAGGDGPAAVTLDAVVQTRVAGLSPEARALLVRVAVAARPLAQQVLLDAAGLSARHGELLYLLRNGNLIRTGGARGRDPVEAYHDRIRELVVASLEPGELRRCHADLVRAIQQGLGGAAPSAADVHALAFHTLGAGDDAAALAWTLRAAREARDRQAPREAARLLETVLHIAHRLGDAAQVRALRPEIAECHRLAGAYDRALDWLGEALGREGDLGEGAGDPSGAGGAERAELLAARGRVHQEKGAHAAAVADLEEALRRFGHRPPGGALSLIVHTVGQVLSYAFAWGRRRAAASGVQGQKLERQAEVLLLLERIYYFTDVRKLVWAAFFGMNLARRSARDVTASLAHGYFGALWFGLGRLARSERHCDRALALAKGSGDRMAEGVALERLGSLALFGNALDRATLLLGRASGELRRVGEEWELCTSLMLEATACFLGGRLGRAVTLWEEMGALAQASGNTVHRAWADAWAPYGRYLQGQLPAGECRATLERAVALSGSVGDVANQVAATTHLAALAVTEGDPQGAAAAARRALETVDRYAVKVPFLHAGLLHVAEAALLGAGAGAGAPAGGERRRLLALARTATRRVLALGKAFPYLIGPALRVQARQVALERGAGAARPLLVQALDRLEESPNLLWRALAHREAGLLGLDTPTMRAGEHAARARVLLVESGATRLLS